MSDQMTAGASLLKTQNTAATRGGWRYQPVITGTSEEQVVTLCECHFDADDRLTYWTEDPAMLLQGDTVSELSRDLVWMLTATWKWLPVPFASLRVGMTFETTGVDVEEMITVMTKVKMRSMA